MKSGSALAEQTVSDGGVVVQDIGNLAPLLYQLGEAVKKTIGNGINPFPGQSTQVPINATCNSLYQICRRHSVPLDKTANDALKFHAKGGFLTAIAKTLLPTVIPFIAGKVLKKTGVLKKLGLGIPQLEYEQTQAEWW